VSKWFEDFQQRPSLDTAILLLKHERGNDDTKRENFGLSIYKTFMASKEEHSAPEMRRMYDALLVWSRSNSDSKDKDARFIFDEIEKNKVPMDDFLFSTLTSNAAQKADLPLAERLASRWHRGPEIRLKRKSALICANQLIKIFTQSQDFEACMGIYTVFLKGGMAPDVGLYSAMFGACVLCGRAHEAEGLYRDMREKGISLEQMSFGYLTRACAHFKDDPGGATKLLVAALTNPSSEASQWHSKVAFQSCAQLISACQKQGDLTAALSVFHFMTLHGIDAAETPQVFASLLTACGEAMAPETGKKLHQLLRESKS